jgi:hypothetical protein
LAGSWEGCIDRSNPTSFAANSPAPSERGPPQLTRLLPGPFLFAAETT